MTGPSRTLATLAAALAVGLAAEAIPASAQPAAGADAARSDTLRQRLEAVASRAQDLAAHFRQMEASVRKSPELQEDAGWASAEEIAWSAHLAGLVGAVAKQAAALDGQLDAASEAGALAERSGMGGRLGRLRGQLEQLTSALESMRGELEAMQGVVHGGEGHGHGH